MQTEPLTPPQGSHTALSSRQRETRRQADVLGPWGDGGQSGFSRPYPWFTFLKTQSISPCHDVTPCNRVPPRGQRVLSHLPAEGVYKWSEKPEDSECPRPLSVRQEHPRHSHSQSFLMNRGRREATRFSVCSAHLSRASAKPDFPALAPRPSGTFQCFDHNKASFYSD